MKYKNTQIQIHKSLSSPLMPPFAHTHTPPPPKPLVSTFSENNKFRASERIRHFNFRKLTLGITFDLPRGYFPLHTSSRHIPPSLPWASLAPHLNTSPISSIDDDSDNLPAHMQQYYVHCTYMPSPYIYGPGKEIKTETLRTITKLVKLGNLPMTISPFPFLSI